MKKKGQVCHKPRGHTFRTVFKVKCSSIWATGHAGQTGNMPKNENATALARMDTLGRVKDGVGGQRAGRGGSLKCWREVEGGKPGRKTMRAQLQRACSPKEKNATGVLSSPFDANWDELGAVASDAAAAACGQLAGLGQPVPADAAPQPGGTGGMPSDTALRRGGRHHEHPPDRFR